MGVMGTYCQVCGLPVQYDHYVPAGDMWAIYRGDGRDSVAPVVHFGPEHVWLREAVGLRVDPSETTVLVEGLIHDGFFEGAFHDFVADGLEERAALHRTCYETIGRPGVWEPSGPIPPRDALAPY